jgi:hypothetical protein
VISHHRGFVVKCCLQLSKPAAAPAAAAAEAKKEGTSLLAGLLGGAKPASAAEPGKGGRQEGCMRALTSNLCRTIQLLARHCHPADAYTALLCVALTAKGTVKLSAKAAPAPAAKKAVPPPPPKRAAKPQEDEEEEEEDDKPLGFLASLFGSPKRVDEDDQAPARG